MTDTPPTSDAARKHANNIIAEDILRRWELNDGGPYPDPRTTGQRSPSWLDFTSAALAIAWTLLLFAVVNACSSALGLSQFTSGFVACVVTALLGAFLWVAMKALTPLYSARWTGSPADEVGA